MQFLRSTFLCAFYKVSSKYLVCQVLYLFYHLAGAPSDIIWATFPVVTISHELYNCPKTVPCGTPEPRCNQSDLLPSIHYHSLFLCLMNKDIQFNTSPVIPQCLSLYNSLSWCTVSNKPLQSLVLWYVCICYLYKCMGPCCVTSVCFSQGDPLWNPCSNAVTILYRNLSFTMCL